MRLRHTQSSAFAWGPRRPLEWHRTTRSTRYVPNIKSSFVKIIYINLSEPPELGTQAKNELPASQTSGLSQGWETGLVILRIRGNENLSLNFFAQSFHFVGAMQFAMLGPCKPRSAEQVCGTWLPTTRTAFCIEHWRSALTLKLGI